MSFLGHAEHQLDAKNRIRIPAKFRSEFGKEFFFMARPQGCIGVYTKEAIDRVVEKFKGVSSGDPKRLQAKRVILGSIEKATEDEQGRIVLSARLREHANLNKDVITVGSGDYLEIWAAEAYDVYNGSMSIDEAFELADI